MKKSISTIVILKIIAIIMLLGALTNSAYSYYQILRWAICGITIYSAYLAYLKEKFTWVWIFVIIAVLFNPISVIYFSKSTWSILDVITAGIILVSIFMLKEEGENNI